MVTMKSAVFVPPRERLLWQCFLGAHVSVAHQWHDSCLAASLGDGANDATLTFIDPSPQVTGEAPFLLLVL